MLKLIRSSGPRRRTRTPPQIIVVPDPDFIVEAREILPIHVLAESWVDVYHTMVEAQLPNIKGDSLER